MDINDITCDQRGIAERITRWRYGLIEVHDSELVSIRGRWLPKMISLVGVWWGDHVIHRHAAGDRVLLYYDQPLFHPRFLALKYVQATSQSTFASIMVGLRVLDRVAELKGIQAIVAEASNKRLTPRVMQRFGFEQHLQQKSDRHFIRRFV